MLVEDSQYNTSGKLPKYEFKKTNLLEIIRQFEITKDRMEKIILQQERTITTSLDYFGTSKTKNTIEEVYELNIRNVELIRDMCENGIKAGNGFIDEIESEIGTLSGTTKFDVDDIRRAINKLNRRTSSIIDRINTNLFISLKSKLSSDEKQRQIEIHNNRVFQDLSSKISSNNHKSMGLLDSLTGISKQFIKLDGNRCFYFGHEVNVEGLKFVNLRRFSEDIKSTNKVLENVDLRTPKEIHEDEVKGGISKAVHWTFNVVGTVATVVSIVYPPAAMIALVSEGLNAAMYFLEGEYQKGFVTGALAVPVFECLNKVDEVVDLVGKRAGSEIGEFISKISKPSTQVNINKRRIGTCKIDYNGKLFKNADVYDSFIDLTVKPIVSIANNSSDGQYEMSEARLDVRNYLIAFSKIISVHI